MRTQSLASCSLSIAAAFAACAPIDDETPPPVDEPTPTTIDVPGGTFTMGSTNGDFDELPLTPLEIAPFEMDITPVTAGAFAARIDEVRAAAPTAEIYAADEKPASWPGDCNVGRDGAQAHPANCVDVAAARA